MQDKQPTEQPSQEPNEVTDEVKEAPMQPTTKTNKKWLLIGGITLAVILVLGFIWFAFGDDKDSTDPALNNQEPTITNYEECVAAGHPVMESYPEQCAVPGGETFTRELTEEEQAKLDDNEVDSTDITDGWVMYKHQETGANFYYPETWGEPTLLMVEWSHTGEGYSIEFSNSEVRGMIATDDYGYTGPGRGGIYWEFGKTDFSEIVIDNEEWAEKAKTSDSYTTNIVGSGENFIVAASSDCLQNGASMVATYDLSYQGGEITVLRLASLATANINCSFVTQDNILDYIDVELQEQFVELGSIL